MKLVCDDDECDCCCHTYDDDDDENTPDELVLVYGSIETFFLPATNSPSPNKDYAKPLSTGLEAIEDVIEGQRDDPGKLYPLDERVRRVIDALQDKIRVLESRGRR